jgi:signal transduction histidine kinase
VKRLPLAKLTIRARLTLVYGGLFLVAGLLLLGVTYVLVSHQLHGGGGATFDTAHPQNSGTSQPAAPLPWENGTEPSLAVNKTIVGQVTDDALQSLLAQGGISLAVVGTAAIAFGWLIAGRLLQPVHRVTETARRIADSPTADRSLHERISLDGPYDEIKQLADTFDIMLERLDHAFDGQRRFIANASHELRTPLTLNRALLEVAVHRRPASPEMRQLGETLLEINTRHERLIDGLLLLARSERDPTQNSFVDLADIVDHVAAQVPPGTVTVHTKLGEAETTGNPVLLERLVQNLVENGARHNIPEDGWVEVASETGPDGSAVLVVSNTGPVVPRYEIPHLFEPFHRLDTDRLHSTAPGAGLGLSIVQAIAHAHRGEVHVEPRDGGGLVVTVTLPSHADTTRAV